MRKKIEEKIQQLKAAFKKSEPIPFRTVEEVTEASRKADTLEKSGRKLEAASTGFFIAGALASAAAAATGVAVGIPVFGLFGIVYLAGMGVGISRYSAAQRINRRIFVSKDEDGRLIERTYNDQELAQLEADKANKNKLEKTRKLFFAVTMTGFGVATVAMFGSAIALSGGAAALVVKPAFALGWAAYGAARLASLKTDSVQARIFDARLHELSEATIRARAALNLVVFDDEDSNLDTAPAAGKDFDAKAGKDVAAPAAEQPAPAAKPAKAPKGPSK